MEMTFLHMTFLWRCLLTSAPALLNFTEMKCESFSHLIFSSGHRLKRENGQSIARTES